ncbi:MAG TPA: NAD(P)/FAD-dependent oxidoreductase [Anaerolineae bacterium]|nr:NAD(P)/FAD-dependent oxidoreductase [Anaerolineae bacterium]HOR01587.1 NAD(P)/FAD-dependent oxidoreductase [Anaerolineae bacterium]
MRIGIIGGGLTGLTAAFDLTRRGYDVILWEAEPRAGGFASGFGDERWEWPLDRFYHHIFQTDRAVLELGGEVGAEAYFPSPSTVIWHEDTMAPFDSPLAALLYPHLNLLEKARVGPAMLYLRLLRRWQPLEAETAEAWLTRTMGERAYQVLWQPLLEGKFGEDYRQVNMAWFWARIHKRSKALGYYEGGFQALADALLQAVRRADGDVRLRAPVRAARPLEDGRWVVETAQDATPCERLIVTAGPQAALRLLPDLPAGYAAQLGALRSLAAMTLVLALDRPLTRGAYWVNLPKSIFPFLALVEHTNYIDRAHYGGDHIVYLGDYLSETHPYYTLDKDELLARYLPYVRRINPAFEPSWIRKSWLFRQSEAQPFTPVGHSQRIPPLRTPCPGLYVANMSQVYPWDRGTNYAVEMGHEVARLAMEDAPTAS